MARKLSETKAIPYFSFDHLVSLITPYVANDDVAERFPLRAAFQGTGFSNDLFYSTYSSREAVGL